MEEQTNTPSSVMDSDSSTDTSTPNAHSESLSSRFIASSQSRNLYQQYLEQQCEVIPGAQSGLLLMPLEEDNVYHPVANWPVGTEFVNELFALVEQVIEGQTALVTALEENASEFETFAVALPIFSDGNLIAVVAVSAQISSQEQLTSVMKIMQLASVGVELIDVKVGLAKADSRRDRLEDGVDLLASVMSEPDYASSAMRLVTELAVALNCDRVCLGSYKKKKSRLEHLSHSTQFGKRMNLVRSIEEVMDEAIDQKSSISYPEVDEKEGVIVQAHQKLSQLQGDSCVLSIPLYINSDIKGALCLERNPERPFTEDDIALCESMAALVVPALEDKRLNDRSLLKKAFDASCIQLRRLLGTGYLGRKLLLIIFACLVVFFSFAEGQYRLSAEARLDSYIQRVVAAPYDGYIYSAVHRAGDVVSKDQVLVRLDDRDLHLEKLKWLSEKAKLTRQYQEALAIHDRAKINIINAQQDQVDAQLQLVNSQLQRAELLAPFDGLIVGGDLSQRLGGAVEKGEVLFEVSPLHFYRINLLVKESRIADLRIGQEGSLHLSALPENPFPFVVTKVTPLTESKDGASYFTVEASLQGQSEQLQPGMEGIGKIYIDDRKLISIWTREMNEWLRLKVWSWWG
jgi:multidrug resistance efflux pump/GAF domain-containing protein